MTKTKMTKNLSLKHPFEKVIEHFKSEDEEVVKESLTAILEASHGDKDDDDDEDEDDEKDMDEVLKKRFQKMTKTKMMTKTKKKSLRKNLTICQTISMHMVVKTFQKNSETKQK